MQAKMEDMQAELENLEAEGMSAGGMVTVTLSGKGLMKGLTVDPSLLVPGEEEMLEDLIIAAHNTAKARVEEITREKTAEPHRRASHSSGNETSDLNPARSL